MERESVVVIAGDVCIDWLSIPVEPLSPADLPRNWQLKSGRHMYARRGGAWLTADFVEAAVGKNASVSKPQGEPNLANVPPEEIIHSMLMLDRYKQSRDRDSMVWAVREFEGYAGPPRNRKPITKQVENDDKNACIVLLDDAGNGFRDENKAWPAALSDGYKPLVVYKVRRPLKQGELWKQLEKSHLDRTIALLSADELRGEGAMISRRLSWERSATDLVLSIAHEPRFNALRNCAFLIVPLGLEGVVLMPCTNGQVTHADLWFEPNLIEGESLAKAKRDMSGFGSAFAAAIVAALIDGLADRESGKLLNHPAIERALRTGIAKGLKVMARLLNHGFGPCEEANERRPPSYPVTEVFLNSPVRNQYIEVRLPNPPRSGDAKKLEDFRFWRILDTKRTEPFEELAADLVRFGEKDVLAQLPVGKFGKLQTIDRLEIESYRSIRNLIREFLKNPNPERPLCLAVFGLPGSGKSFGVTQVALDVAGEGQIEKIDFNVSQWEQPQYLIHALHRVRDYALRGKVPLVFFDEFDSKLVGQKLGWLKYFLEPMQDGVFADGISTHQIGKAIFVFAGGTAFNFEEFRTQVLGAAAADSYFLTGDYSLGKREAKPPKEAEQSDEMKAAKGRDFLSRLRGHVNVFGLDGPAGTNLVRRAFVLRSNLVRKFSSLLDSASRIQIDDGVLRAFLRIPRFEHGARSLEAILDMSNLVGQRHFDPSMLPPRQQLNLHVNGDAFMVIVRHQQTLGAKLDEIAKRIHKVYIEAWGPAAKGKAVMRELQDLNAFFQNIDELWNGLNDLHKNSSREQAAYYPSLLQIANCEFEAAEPDSKVEFKFTDTEIERLATMEHERWVEERRIKQPNHPDLIPWDKLPQSEKDKDILFVQAIPKVLAHVGLAVTRSSDESFANTSASGAS